MAGKEAVTPEVIGVTQVEVKAPGGAAEKTDFPAFLEKDERTGEYKLPEGYEYLKENSEAILGDGVKETVFYFGCHGARLARGEGDSSGTVFFKLEGVPLPKEGKHSISRPDPDNVFGVEVEELTSKIPPEGVPLNDGWRLNIHEGKSGVDPMVVEFYELYIESPPYKVVDITPPRTIVLGGKEIDFTDYFYGMVGVVNIKGGKIVIKCGYEPKIAVPSVAVEPPATESALAPQPTPEPAPVVPADELPDWLRAPAVEVLVAPTAEAPASLPVEPAAGAAEPSIHEAIPAKPEPEAPAPQGHILTCRQRQGNR